MYPLIQDTQKRSLSISPSLGPADMRRVGVALVLALGLCWAAYRQGILLSYDGYHYCELAKTFSASWPDHLGDFWPFGWPLLGGLVARTGLVGGYGALLLLAFASLTLILLLAVVAVAQVPARLAVLCAIAAAPVMAVQVVGVLTELPFTACTLALALTLAQANRPSACWLAAACCLSGFTIRYAGIFLPAIWAVWLVANGKNLAAEGRLQRHGLAWLVTVLLAGLLIATNLVYSGLASGGDRGAPGSLLNLPRQLALFGWSAPSALVAGGVRDLIGAESALGLAIGGTCFAGLALFLGWCLLDPRSQWTRPLALTALGYAFAIAAMRSVAYFDGVYNARTFLPVVPPLFILVAERAADRPRLLIALCVLSCSCGLMAAVRGVSRQTSADVRPAIGPLLARLDRNSTIGINDYAYTVAAYVRQPTTRVFIESLAPSELTTFVIIAGKPLQRSVIDQPLSPEWRLAVHELVRKWHYEVILDNGGLVLLQKPSPTQ